jgi:hypothetical protein
MCSQPVYRNQRLTVDGTGLPNISSEIGHYTVHVSWMFIQVWSRLEVPWRTWPWRFLACDPSLPSAAAVVDEFYQSPGCCLDEWASEPIRTSIPRSAWTGSSMDAQSMQLLLREIRRQIKVTNMQMERHLKESRTVVQGKFPGAECMAYSTLLRQLWHAHIELGGDNLLKETRDDMVRLGLPLIPFKGNDSVEAVRKPSVAFSWTMKRFHVLRASHGPSAVTRLSSDDLAQSWREWHDLPEHERDAFAAQMPQDPGMTNWGAIHWGGMLHWGVQSNGF